MKLHFEYNARSYSLDLARNGRIATVIFDGQTYTLEATRSAGNRLDLRISAASDSATSHSSVLISSSGSQRWVTCNGQTFLLTHSSPAARRGAGAQHAAGALSAPMPGQVRAVQVTAGERVIQGQTLVVIEAMKMELKITAPFDGVVQTVAVANDQTVEKDQPLVDVSPV